MSGWGKLSAHQVRRVANTVRGRIVHDLGAGSLGFALAALRMGAQRVVAVDCERFPRVAVLGDKLELHEQTFERYLHAQVAADARFQLDVVALVWPVNHLLPGLVPLVRRARAVVYLGKNTDGMACGGADLWRELTHRQVVAHVPDPKNDLIIYGPSAALPRPLLPEERGATEAEVLFWRSAHGRPCRCYMPEVAPSRKQVTS